MNEIRKRKIKPSYLLPLWDLMGGALGFGTALMGKKAAMLCTASVEEVIEDHYENQLKKIGNDEMELKAKIEKFKGEEVEQKNIAYEAGATNKGFYNVMDKIINSDENIILYIGETISAEKRWKGEHDCKNYLSSYSDTLQKANMTPKLNIRFWLDVPIKTKERRKLEQKLIQTWLPPFNKETRGIWATPFTSQIS